MLTQETVVHCLHVQKKSDQVTNRFTDSTDILLLGIQMHRSLMWVETRKNTSSLAVGNVKFFALLRSYWRHMAVSDMLEQRLCVEGFKGAKLAAQSA